MCFMAPFNFEGKTSTRGVLVLCSVTGKLEICIIREGPLGDIRLLVSQVMQGMGLAPFVSLVVLVNITCLRSCDSIEGSDCSTSQPGQRTEDRGFSSATSALSNWSTISSDSLILLSVS